MFRTVSMIDKFNHVITELASFSFDAIFMLFNVEDKVTEFTEFVIRSNDLTKLMSPDVKVIK